MPLAGGNGLDRGETEGSPSDGRPHVGPQLLQGGVHVSGHTAAVEPPGLLTDPEALRSQLGQRAVLAKLLSLR